MGQTRLAASLYLALPARSTAKSIGNRADQRVGVEFSIDLQDTHPAKERSQ